MYLEVQLDRRLSFGEHLKIAAAKANQCGATLALLMPNIDGPREAKRRLVASVVHSKLLYATQVWAKTLQKKECCVGPGERSANSFIRRGKAEDLSAPQGAFLYQLAGNHLRKGGHLQGSKAQTRREMADEMAWRVNLAEQKTRRSRLLCGASAFRPWLFKRVPETLQEERRGDVLLLRFPCG